MPFGVTVTVERPAGSDAYGNPLPPSTHTISGCAFAPRGVSTEDDKDFRVEVITSLTMAGPPGADLEPQDVVIDPSPYAGRWQMEGELGLVRSPLTGWQPGTIAVLKRVEG